MSTTPTPDEASGNGPGSTDDGLTAVEMPLTHGAEEVPEVVEEDPGLVPVQTTEGDGDSRRGRDGAAVVPPEHIQPTVEIPLTTIQRMSGSPVPTTPPEANMPVLPTADDGLPVQRTPSESEDGLGGGEPLLVEAEADAELDQALEKAVNEKDRRRVLSTVLRGADVTRVPAEVREEIYAELKEKNRQLKQAKRDAALSNMTKRARPPATAAGNMRPSLPSKNNSSTMQGKLTRHGRRTGRDLGIPVKSFWDDVVAKEIEEKRRVVTAPGGTRWERPPPSRRGDLARERKAKEEESMKKFLEEDADDDDDDDETLARKERQARRKQRELMGADILNDAEYMDRKLNPVRPVIEFEELLETGFRVKSMLGWKEEVQKARREARATQLKERVEEQREDMRLHAEMEKLKAQQKLELAQDMAEERRVEASMRRRTRREMAEKAQRIRKKVITKRVEASFFEPFHPSRLPLNSPMVKEFLEYAGLDHLIQRTPRKSELAYEGNTTGQLPAFKVPEQAGIWSLMKKLGMDGAEEAEEARKKEEAQHLENIREESQGNARGGDGVPKPRQVVSFEHTRSGFATGNLSIGDDEGSATPVVRRFSGAQTAREMYRGRKPHPPATSTRGSDNVGAEESGVGLFADEKVPHYLVRRRSSVLSSLNPRSNAIDREKYKREKRILEVGMVMGWDPGNMVDEGLLNEARTAWQERRRDLAHEPLKKFEKIAKGIESGQSSKSIGLRRPVIDEEKVREYFKKETVLEHEKLRERFKGVIRPVFQISRDCNLSLPRTIRILAHLANNSYVNVSMEKPGPGVPVKMKGSSLVGVINYNFDNWSLFASVQSAADAKSEQERLREEHLQSFGAKSNRLKIDPL